MLELGPNKLTLVTMLLHSLLRKERFMYLWVDKSMYSS